MKTKLLKLALCAFVATLPIGAWGQTPTSWDFTSWSDGTTTNLNTDNTNWGYTAATTPATGGYWDYKLATAAESGGQAILANGNAITELNGLTFYWPAASGGGRIRIDNRSTNKALYFKSSQERVFVPNLTAGKKVSINYRAPGANNIQMHAIDSKIVAYKQAAASSANKTDVFIVSSKVTSAAAFAFNSDNAVNIFSITVTDATQDELNYANSKTMFGNDDVITATSLWIFDQYKNGDAISDGSYSGIYLKGHDTGENKSVAGNKQYSNSFGAYTVNTRRYLDVKGGYKDIIYSTVQTRTASSTIQDCISLNIGVAGKLYISASLGAASRSIKVYKGNTGDITSESTVLIANHAVTTANEPETFSVDIEKAGTYWITGANGGSGSGYRFNAMMFIPTEDKEVAMTKTVTLTSAGGGYATFSAAQNYVVPEGVTAYYVSSVDGTEKKAMMTAINAGSVIPACTGVVLYKSGVTSDTEITLTSTETYSSVTNSMMPNLAAYALPNNDGTNYNYTLAYDGAPVFKHVASENPGTLAAGKAFLRTTVNVPAGSRGMNLVFDEDNTTGIETISNNQEENKGNHVFYNLKGQRVNNPTKGLYIVNGKKVFIK